MLVKLTKKVIRVHEKIDQTQPPTRINNTRMHRRNSKFFKITN